MNVFKSTIRQAAAPVKRFLNAFKCQTVLESKLMRRSSKLLLGLMGAAACAFGATVNANTAILIDVREPGPLQKAAADLAADLGRTFGRPARIVRNRLDAGASVVWIGLNQTLPASIERPRFVSGPS